MRRILVLLTVAMMAAVMLSVSGVALAQGGDVCVSIKGDEKVDKGDSECFSDETSKAVATKDSAAVAVDNSKAIAHNDGVAVAVEDSSAMAVNCAVALTVRDPHIRIRAIGKGGPWTRGCR